MIKLLIIFLLLFINTASAETTIDLPTDHADLWRNECCSHYVIWNFYNKFGSFPDRDGAYMNYTESVGNKNWQIVTDKNLTPTQIQKVKDFFADEANYQEPTFANKMVFTIDWDGIITKLNNYFSDDPTMKITYIAEGEKQKIYFSRALTVQEKTVIKNKWKEYITIE